MPSAASGLVLFDIDDESDRPYVAGWGENGALDAVTDFAQLIDDLARRVESALSAAGDT